LIPESVTLQGLLSGYFLEIHNPILWIEKSGVIQQWAWTIVKSHCYDDMLKAHSQARQTQGWR